MQNVSKCFKPFFSKFSCFISIFDLNVNIFQVNNKYSVKIINSNLSQLILIKNNDNKLT